MAQPQVPQEYQWFKDLLNYPAVLIHGAQGSGKTSLAAFLMRQKIIAGHQVEIYDPHKKYGQWEGLRVVGEGMDYEALDEELLKYAKGVKADYSRRAAETDYSPSKSSVLVEEFTNWADHCKQSGLFFKASLSDIRKIGYCVVYVSHGRTLGTLGGSKGVAATRDSSMLELELLAKVDPVSGEAVPVLKGLLKYPGKEPVEVAIATWMNGSMDFTSVVESAKTSGSEAVQKRFKGQELRTSEPGTVQDVNRAQDNPFGDLESNGSEVQNGRFKGVNLDLSDDSAVLNHLEGLKGVGLNQDQIIYAIWGFKKGGTQVYAHARSEYKRLTHEG
jgi:hypothetical protein